MVLTFLFLVFKEVLKVVVKPMLHTLDQVNDSLVKLTEATSSLNGQIGVMVDRRLEAR